MFYLRVLLAGMGFAAASEYGIAIALVQPRATTAARLHERPLRP